MKVLDFMRDFRYMALSLFALTFVACTSDADYTLGRWKQRSDFDGKARTYAAYFSIGDMGYVVGGYNGKTDRLKSMYSYNMTGNYYTEIYDDDYTGTCPVGRQYATGFAVNGKGYVCCGYDGNNYLKDTWEFNPLTNTWAQKDDFAGTARYGALGFGLESTKKGYVLGGYDENFLKECYVFDPTAASGSQWIRDIGYGGTKREFGSSFIINNVAYIVGGQNNGGDCEDMWKFDGTAWTQLRDIVNNNEDEDYDDDYTSITRNSAVAFSLNGKGYVALGCTSGNVMRDNYWIYDPTTDLWSNNDGDVTAFSADKGRTRTNAAMFTNGSRAFFTTGNSGSSTFFDDTWEFVPNEYKEKD